MKIGKGKFAALLLSLSMVLGVAGCGNVVANNSENLASSVTDTSTKSSSVSATTTTIATTTTTDSSKAQVSSKNSDSKSADSEVKTGTSKASLLCVGDNLIHDNIYVEALKNGGGKKYDFSSCYEYIKKYIDADVAIMNQETLVTDSVAPSSYPTFASPLAVADEDKALGFNVISMSNNHVLDQGETGLINSLAYWDKIKMTHYGAYRSEDDANNIRTMKVNGITFAFLGYMQHTNGISLADNATAKVIYLNDEEKIKAQVEQADKIADVVVVSCHFGTEIRNEINDQQKTLSPKLVKWGADLIIGTQAHALSTCEYLDKADGTKAFVFYGLGNFFSTMYDKDSLIGIMGKLNVIKDNATGAVSFKNIKCIPVISHFEATSYNSMWYNCKVYPYAKYTDKLFAKNFVSADGFNRTYVDSILKTYVPSKFLSIE